MQGPTPQSRIHFSGALVPISPPLECVAHEGGWVVPRLGRKLSTGYPGSRASGEMQAKVS